MTQRQEHAQHQEKGTDHHIGQGLEGHGKNLETLFHGQGNTKGPAENRNMAFNLTYPGFSQFLEEDNSVSRVYSGVYC